ncbi:MAG: tRNA (guanine37-N1)-methyltransferase [bacterium]|jgi:tRNA (guanine37-N1)-methyltransferase
MLHFQILTLFPEIFSSFLSQSLLKKAVDQERIKVDLINFRKHGIGKHLKVDDYPYGGGAGMLLRPEPIVETLQECDSNFPNGTHKILISPQGKPFNQKKAVELSQSKKPLVFICGRYEGFDERIHQFIDEEICLGDFILLGGEVAAMTIIEATSRLIPEVIGNAESLEHETFSHGLLEYAQYTRPSEFMGHQVPDILLSGNHPKIEEWRQESALQKTKDKRPELFVEYQNRHTSGK